MASVTHIIGRQKIRLRYQGATDTLALRQMVSQVCGDELPARLSQLLDRYDVADQVLHIGKLNVQVSVSDGGDLHEILARAIIEKIEAALRATLEHRPGDGTPVDERFSGILRYYLGHGYLPWWSPEKDSASFRQTLEQALTAPALQQLVPEILPVLGSLHARKRLILLLKEARFDAFVLATGVWQAAEWTAWKESLSRLARAVSPHSGAAYLQHFRDAALRVAYARPAAGGANAQIAALLKAQLPTDDIVRLEEAARLLAPSPVKHALLAAPASGRAAGPQTLQETGSKATLPDPRPSPPPGAPDEGELIRVGNAGLVLVALYLPNLFRHVGLLKEIGLQDPARAAGLLRYLVFEDEPYEEFDLVLEKILCGLPLSECVEGPHRVSVEEREQVNALLQSVIEHWTVLKNTTPAGLRHSFLQRDGRLTFRNSQWELTVQKEAHDILLDYLPWNISMIKLPWMRGLLTVRW